MGQGCFKPDSQNLDFKKKNCNKCKKPINSHIHECSIQTTKTDLHINGTVKPILQLSKTSHEINKNFNYATIYGTSCHQINDQINIFKTPQKTQTKWIKQFIWNFPINIKSLKPQQIRKLSFQQKLFWLRTNLQTLRVSWQKGCQILNVDRGNLLMSSKQKLNKLNLRKQIKINFDDEQVDDAGGLLREWMHLSIKQIFHHEMGIFKLTDCPQLYYKFCWDENLVEEYVIEMVTVLGMIIGKAIFQRISINCHLDRTILRQICGSPVYFEDVYSYDAKFYKCWKQLLQMKDASQLGLDFCIYHSNENTNQLNVVKLIPDGQKKVVNNSNRQEYIRLMIHNYCSLSCKRYIQVLRQNIYKVVPFQFLSVFQPIQLEMILTGPQVIDILDWKNHTLYRGYIYSDSQIVWFWNFVQKLSQQKLQNLLHYITGSSKVPILGFKYLQSNRNQIAPFTIQKVDYTENNPYPKSHTCFNRLQLPSYKTEQQAKKYLKLITQNQLTHFGLS